MGMLVDNSIVVVDQSSYILQMDTDRDSVVEPESLGRPNQN